MKVSKQVFGLIMSVTIGFIMSLLISLALLLVNLGFVDDFFFIWMQSFATSFLISVPIALVMFPLTQSLLLRIFQVQE
ncbi:MAG: DUF2798 domain-containing protein [Chloroflexi bacterium AL-N1]|nr:DUF2798 domain-containing protein [Chloroflexi bacterium AL-N1]NOK77385.1 DUF2798 domain-containing protein [Chloroflexi bacterium AL-N5]